MYRLSIYVIMLLSQTIISVREHEINPAWSHLWKDR